MAEPITYVVTMERIGRARNLPPLEVVGTGRDGDQVAEAVWRMARGHLGSKHFEVDANIETGIVLVESGRFGTGTVVQKP